MKDLQDLINVLTEAQSLQDKFARCVEITPADVRSWLMGDEWYDPNDPAETGIPPEPEWELVKDVDDTLLSEAIALFCNGSDEVSEFMEKAAHRIAKDYIRYAISHREFSV